MKRYLNRQEKDEAFTMGALIGFLEKLIANQEARTSKNGVILRGLKLAKHWATTALDEVFKPLDQTERKKVIGEMGKLDVVVKYTKEAQQERKQREQDDKYTHVLTDDLYDICGHTWAGFCKWTCPYKDDAEKNCPLWPLFHKHDFPVIDDTVPEGRCPYRYDKQDRGPENGKETV